MDHSEWFWFNLLAVGPALFCACLLLNFLVHGPEERMLVPRNEPELLAYWREQGGWPPHLPWPNDFGSDPAKDRAALEKAGLDDTVYALAKGCLGYVVITQATPVRNVLPPAEN